MRLVTDGQVLQVTDGQVRQLRTMGIRDRAYGGGRVAEPRPEVRRLPLDVPFHAPYPLRPSQTLLSDVSRIRAAGLRSEDGTDIGLSLRHLTSLQELSLE